MNPIPPPPQSPMELPRERPAPLDYRAAPPSSGRRIFSTGAAIVAMVFAGAVTLLLGVIVPLFERVFKDFGVALPSVTMAVLQIARAFRQFGWLEAWLMPVAAGFIAPRFGANARRERRAMLLILQLALSLLAAIVVLALGAPMVSLINATSKQ